MDHSDNSEHARIMYDIANATTEGSDDDYSLDVFAFDSDEESDHVRFNPPSRPYKQCIDFSNNVVNIDSYLSQRSVLQLCVEQLGNKSKIGQRTDNTLAGLKGSIQVKPNMFLLFITLKINF